MAPRARLPRELQRRVTRRDGVGRHGLRTEALHEGVGDGPPEEHLAIELCVEVRVHVDEPRELPGGRAFGTQLGGKVRVITVELEKLEVEVEALEAVVAGVRPG